METHFKGKTLGNYITFRASRRNIMIYCYDKMCIYKINGLGKES